VKIEVEYEFVEKERAPSFQYTTGYASNFSVSNTHRKKFRQLVVGVGGGALLVVMRLLGLGYSVRRDHVSPSPL